MSNPNLASLAIWLEEHQHENEQTKTKVILLDSLQDNGVYKFEAAFMMFVLEGEIDLSTNDIGNGSLYFVTPVWGRVNLVEDITGNLENSVTGQFSRGPNFDGSFTLSLVKRELIIDYDFTVKFVGNVTDKLALFTLPEITSSSNSPSDVFPVTKFTMGHGGHKLFDKFFDEYFDEETHNFVITEYRSSGASSSSGKEFFFHVSFLDVLEVRGAIDPVTLAMVGELNATVPLWGRAKISLMSGNLKDGIDLSINAFVARGTFGLRLSGKDMRSLVDLDVKSAGKIKDDIKLLTLPL